jgi:hypothetical protein
MMSSSYSTSQSSDNASAPEKNSLTEESSSSSVKETLALPEVPHDQSKTTTLDLSGGSTSIALDHLGPMVVNVDGTLCRISNWDKMAEIEKKNTLRIIGKRNQARLEALRAKADDTKQG